MSLDMLDNIKLPSDEELMEISLPHWKIIEPTLLSRLHKSILDISIPTRFFSLDNKTIVNEFLPAYDGKKTSAGEILLNFANSALDSFPGGVFFKMDGRSPKDTEIVRITRENTKDLIPIFFMSERILDDIARFRLHRELFFFCFREWVNLSDEHRVFICDGRVAGVSRYDYTLDKPDNMESPGFYMEKARAFCERISKYFPQPNFVFDIAKKDSGEWVLVEVNPWGLSDPCLFGSYNKIDGYIS